jgi:hypothetical protein
LGEETGREREEKGKVGLIERGGVGRETHERTGLGTRRLAVDKQGRRGA